MEPAVILIYVSSLVILTVGVMFFLVLLRLYRILTKIDRVLDYAEHIVGILEAWESIPAKLITGIIKKIFK